MTELEQQILNTVQQSMQTAIKESLAGYHSPLRKLCDDVVTKHLGTIREVFDASVSETFSSKEFAESVRESMDHKIAKALVSQLEGTIDKAVNALKADPTMKAKMILAIENIVKDANKKAG